MENNTSNNTKDKGNAVLYDVSDSTDFYEEDYYDEEDVAYEFCPKCGRHYDEIDVEYQCCSKCGWDAEKNKWTKPREPQKSDYLNGEADILTGRWY